MLWKFWFRFANRRILETERGYRFGTCFEGVLEIATAIIIGVNAGYMVAKWSGGYYLTAFVAAVFSGLIWETIFWSLAGIINFLLWKTVSLIVLPDCLGYLKEREHLSLPYTRFVKFVESRKDKEDEDDGPAEATYALLLNACDIMKNVAGIVVDQCGSNNAHKTSAVATRSVQKSNKKVGAGETIKKKETFNCLGLACEVAKNEPEAHVGQGAAGKDGGNFPERNIASCLCRECSFAAVRENTKNNFDPQYFKGQSGSAVADNDFRDRYTEKGSGKCVGKLVEKDGWVEAEGKGYGKCKYLEYLLKQAPSDKISVRVKLFIVITSPFWLLSFFFDLLWKPRVITYRKFILDLNNHKGCVLCEVNKDDLTCLEKPSSCV